VSAAEQVFTAVDGSSAALSVS